jgi:hypothetical protein
MGKLLDLLSADGQLLVPTFILRVGNLGCMADSSVLVHLTEKSELIVIPARP